MGLFQGKELEWAVLRTDIQGIDLLAVDATTLPPTNHSAAVEDVPHTQAGSWGHNQSVAVERKQERKRSWMLDKTAHGNLSQTLYILQLRLRGIVPTLGTHSDLYGRASSVLRHSVIFETAPHRPASEERKRVDDEESDCSEVSSIESDDEDQEMYETGDHVDVHNPAGASITHCTAALPLHCCTTTVLLHYHYTAALPLYCCTTTILLHYHCTAALPLYCCTTTVLLHYHYTAALPLY
eukprot:Lankesteria_metandrocarpae@DN1919_c0_g1_i1.p1